MNNNYNILVVEDDAPVRNLITTTLKANEYKFITAANGSDAIMSAVSHNPDIVLLDLGLPDMDGVDVIEKIRRARLNGFTHYMIVVAEGSGSANEIAAKIKESIDLDPRVTVLGHIQRGGVPTGRDRVNATKMGYLAVELLLEGKTNRIVCTKNGTFMDVSFEEGLAMERRIQKLEVEVLAAMTGL